jgi:hypothetical protein
MLSTMGCSAATAAADDDDDKVLSSFTPWQAISLTF